MSCAFFFFQAEDGIRDPLVTGVQTCALPILDFLNEFLRELKIEKASLVGESLGGWISALYAVELVEGGHLIPMDKLVLVDAEIGRASCRESAEGRGLSAG